MTRHGGAYGLGGVGATIVVSDTFGKTAMTDLQIGGRDWQ
jgi:hypothetical protein